MKLRILEDVDNVDVLIGVSPNSSNVDDTKCFEVILPKSKRIIAKRLVFKHRNSLELNVFLAHINFHFSKKGMMFSSMSNDEDMPLEASCFPAIDKVSCLLNGLPCPKTE